MQINTAKKRKNRLCGSNKILWDIVMIVNNVLRTRVSTGLSQRTGVWRVWVSVVITEVFGNVVACQLGHNVGDVAKRAEVLQPFMSTT